MVKTMVKTPLQFRGAQLSLAVCRSRLTGFLPGASLITIAALAAWMPAVSARPYVRVQSNGYDAMPRQVINFPPVVSFPNAAYSSVQTTIQPGFGSGLSVQIGTPNVYPSNVYPSGLYPSGYGYGQSGVIQRRGVNNSVLINPTVINSPIRNSTLINPTIVTTPSGASYSTPYYPSPYLDTPYFDTQTITTTTRPEPEVYIDPQYGVRYRSPTTSAPQQVIIYPSQIVP